VSRDVVPPDPTLADVQSAGRTIAATVHRTTLIESPLLSARCGSRVWLKPECQQKTGAFKIRGAANKILRLTDAERGRGIITASSGNHGRAVARVARDLGLRAVVCMSRRVVQNKVDAIARYGAEVVTEGETYDDAERRAFALAADQGLTWISAFDDPHIIAGQGTIGLELADDLPDLDTALVPLSGGGLISGVALALKSLRPATRVVGVSMERAPMMYLSLAAGHPVEVDERDTLADALVGNIGGDNLHTFRMVQRLVDEVVLVSEEAIGEAMGMASVVHDLTVEGGGAVGLAALLGDQVAHPGAQTAVVLSGGNVAPELTARGRDAWNQRRAT
jgi:threonine dehydratase